MLKTFFLICNSKLIHDSKQDSLYQKKIFSVIQSEFRAPLPDMIWAYSAKITHNSLFDVSACLNATAIQALFDNITMKRTNNGPPSGTINKLQTQSNINDSKNEMVGLG